MPFTAGPALLFSPGHRPDRVLKAAAVADAVILDLEDGVPDEAKQDARDVLSTLELDPARVIVRVNGSDPAALALDLAALRATPYRTVMVSKCESVDQFVGFDGFAVIAQVETPRGVVNAFAIADHPSVTAMFWGSEDLASMLGGTSSRDADGRYRAAIQHARTTVLYAAAAAGVPAIDAIHADFQDDDGLAFESADAAASGFAATACIHPRQVAIVRAGYAPTPEQLASARAIVDAAAGRGAIALDGQMVDEPVVAQARRVISRAIES